MVLLLSHELNAPSAPFLIFAFIVWKSPGPDPTKNTVWDNICRYKQPVLEPKQTDQLAMAMADYYAKARALSLTHALLTCAHLCPNL